LGTDPPADGYPEALVSSEQIAKDIFDGADSSGTGLDMLRAQLLGSKLNALAFPGFADAYLTSGEKVSDVMALADQILHDEANGIHHEKSEITGVKDLLDAANNNHDGSTLVTCPPSNPTPTPTSPPTGTPTPTPTPSPTPGTCQAFNDGLTKGYWKTHTGLDSPPRDSAYDSLPILLGSLPDIGAPEMLIANEEDARDAFNNANSSGYGYTMLRAQLLAAELNSIKFPGFENTSFPTGEVLSNVMSDAHTLLDDAANGISHEKSELILISDLLDSANNNSHTPVLKSCPDTAAPASSGTDYDGDGFSDEVEGLHLGTNAAASCGAGNWPADLVPGGMQPNTVNLLDLGSFLAPVQRLGTGPGDAGYDPRWDLQPGSMAGPWINLLDMAALVAGTTGSPPMFGGQRAFGKACVSTPDDDNDRVANTYDNCAAQANSDQANWDADPRGDICDDDEGDGFTDATEFHVGTSPSGRCEGTDWPANLNDGSFSNDEINLLDISTFVAPVRRLDTSPGDAAYDARWDLVPGAFGSSKVINLLDLSLLVTFKPPMFGGQRAFNGPNCTP